MTKVALSGAGGQVGSVLRPRLLERGVKLRSGGGMNPLTPLSNAEEVMHGDLRDPEVVDRLLQGVDVLIHLAGTSVERPLPEIIENNLRALHEIYEGARRHGVKRIVFASSNHAFGMYSVTDKLSIDAPFRPDGFYGLSKAWGEDMTRMYWDKHGIEGISVRIGSTLERPTEFRHLSTWFGYEDVTQFMMCCIEAREVGYLAVWGVSNNTRSYWDNSVAERIGYRPVQNAEGVGRLRTMEAGSALSGPSRSNSRPKLREVPPGPHLRRAPGDRRPLGLTARGPMGRVRHEHS